MIAGKQSTFLSQAEAKVIGGVPRRVNRIHGPARADNDVAIFKANVRHKVTVAALFDPRAVIMVTGPVRTEGERFCPTPFLQRFGRRRMVGVRVRDKDMRDAFSV